MVIKTYSFLIKIFQKITLIFLLLFFVIFIINFIENNNYENDDITLVTALFEIKSKYNFSSYLTWVNNLLKINTSIVFFIDSKISKMIKNMRPKIYQNKTVWIQTNIKNFYTYKKFKNNFKKTYSQDNEKKIHTILLYLVWAEKCFFLKRAIKKNYFKSKCFYWIDAGFFRKKNYINYLNGWPSKKKCIQDPRVLINSIRKRNMTRKELGAIKDLNITKNTILKQFLLKPNVGGGFFGGQSNYLIKFINLYYNTIKLFIKKRLFIGKDQNLFAYIAWFHQDIVNIIYSGDWHYLLNYLK